MHLQNIYTLEYPKINVLTIGRQDRITHIITEFANQGVEDYEFWFGKKFDPPFTAISQSHKMIVQNAKKNGLEMCCISEDDVKFSDKGSWQYFIENIPKNFDLYLSSIYYGQINEYNIVEDFSALTLYIIHSRYYDTFLSTPENVHIDRGQCKWVTLPTPTCETMPMPRGRFVVCNPFTSFQIEGYSDNVKRQTNYFQEYMSHRKFYARSVAANNDLIATSL